MMTKCYRSYQVANYIIKQENKSNKILTALRLLKLVYICHGYSLAILGNPLISDKIEAWKYGPIIPDLYDSLRSKCTRPLSDLLEDEKIAKLDIFQRKLVENVLFSHGKLDGLQLSTLTSDKSTPWDLIWRNPHVDGDIPNSLIMEFYSGLLNK